MKSYKLNIFGAGLVGSLISLMLARQGHTVNLFERRPDMRKAKIPGGRSINLALSDRGWKALEKVGLQDQILEMALPMEGRMVHDREGKTEFQPYGRKDQAIYSVSRGGLNKAILDALDKEQKVKTHFQHKLAWLYTEENYAELEYLPTGGTMNFDADFQIGTDGAFSAARLSMQMKSGFSYSQDYLPHGYKELRMPPKDNGDFAMAPNALHIWPREDFMLIALPNPDKSFTCTLFMPYKGAQGFDALQNEEQIKAFFQSEFPDAIALMPNYLQDFQENPTGSLVTVRCSPWNWDKTLLIGDAAHAIVPFYGQGMNAGFEDCRLLVEDLEHTENWKQAFADYQAKRKPNADAIADLALYNYIEMRDKVAADDFQKQKTVEKALAQHFPEDWQTRYSMVTFSHRPYAEAKSIGEAHDRFFREVVLQEEDIVEKAQSFDHLKRWLDAFKQYAKNT